MAKQTGFVTVQAWYKRCQNSNGKELHCVLSKWAEKGKIQFSLTETWTVANVMLTFLSFLLKSDQNHAYQKKSDTTPFNLVSNQINGAETVSITITELDGKA